MFVRVIIAQLKMAARSKKYMFWTLAFPLVLGTLFFFAFNSIYDSQKSESIPVVIKYTDNTMSESDHPFIKLMDELEYEDGTEMIDVVETASDEEAEQLLSDGDIAGIITVDSLTDIELLVNGNGVKHSILSSIISEYKLKVEKAMNSPQGGSTEDIEYIEAKGLAGDNKDPFITYFYNLIAMICIMGSVASLNTIVDNQANQSNTGMRIDSSPVSKIAFELAQVVSVIIMQILIITITLIYLINILGLNFGGDILMVYLTSYLASIVGVALGYMVAHIGKMSIDKKETILMVIILGGGFMSGLMMGDMKIIMEQKAPWFNRINPSAVITDAFYALNVFGVGDRYMRSVLYLVITSVAMLLIGCILSRRNSYKSL